MKQTLLLLTLLISDSCIAGEYSDCILENMKGVQVKSAVNQVRAACREKSLPYVPAKCYDKVTQDISAKKIYDYSDGFKDRISQPVEVIHDATSENESAKYFGGARRITIKNTVNNSCVNKCLNASYWSKHFGECKE